MVWHLQNSFPVAVLKNVCIVKALFRVSEMSNFNKKTTDELTLEQLCVGGV